jgi:hypothetical protein
VGWCARGWRGPPPPSPASPRHDAPLPDACLPRCPNAATTRPALSPPPPLQESPALTSGVTLAALLRDAPPDVRARYARWLRAPPGARPAASTASAATAAGLSATPSPAKPGAPGGGGAGGGSAAAASPGAAEDPAARALAYAQDVSELHRSFRDCCEMMGVGLGAPRGDTVAEVGCGAGRGLAVGWAGQGHAGSAPSLAVSAGGPASIPRTTPFACCRTAWRAPALTGTSETVGCPGGSNACAALQTNAFQS